MNFAVLCTSGSLSVVLLGQAMETPTTIVGAFVLVFVAFASLIGWIIKRLFDKTIPEQQTMFEMQLEKSRAMFSAQLDKEREFFKESLQEVLAAFKTAHSDLVTRLEKISRLNGGP